MAIREGRRLIYTAIALTIVGMITGFAIGFAVAPSNGGSSGGEVSGLPGPQNHVDVEFTLDAFILGYVGVGGDIDGVTNPDLNVGPGDTVKITIINGENIEHDVAVENLDVLSSRAPREGDTTSVTFTAPQAEGSYLYLCTVAGHREAGMEGKLVVGEGGHGHEEAGPVATEVTLKTFITGYVAVGGDDDGVINPDIKVHPGDTVKLTLINGQDVEHDVAVEDLGVQSSRVHQEGDSISVTFIVPEIAGTYFYYCTLSGHRVAGMEGNLIVINDGHEHEEAGPAGPVDVGFTLETFITGYVGVGGDIDGVINPDIKVQPGDTVELIIINGQDMEHDVAVEDLGVHSAHVNREGETISLSFTVPEDAKTYVYYCTLSGHQTAGMEGNLIVIEDGDEHEDGHEHEL